MKRSRHIAAAILCAVLMLTVFPFTAFAGSYSEISTEGLYLEYPDCSDYYDTPFTARVKASRANGSIYIMPVPQKGNGHLGTVRNNETVTILAKKNGFYFFVTKEGYEGWNGTKFFTVQSSRSGSGSASRSGKTVSDTGDELQYPSSYLRSSFTATVKASRKNGSIYLMPMPQKGHGNLGTVKNGSKVTILAKENGFYFFRTSDGRYGWNGTKFFR